MGNDIFEKLQILSENMEQQKILNKEILNLKEASQYLGISKSCLYKKTSLNKIPFFKPGNKINYFLKSDLDLYMLGNRQASTEEIKESAINFKLNSKKRSTL